MALIESCSGISKSFGSRFLFENISLGISEGERLGLIGPNGSGKSTLLKILSGRPAPDSGPISMRGNPGAGCAPRAAVSPGARSAGGVIPAALAGERLDELEHAAR